MLVTHGATLHIHDTKGLHLCKNTSAASEVLKVGNDLAFMLFRAWFIDCKKSGDNTKFSQWNTGGDVRIGNTTAQVAIATAKDPSYNLNVGGSSQVEMIRASDHVWGPTGAYCLNTDTKMHQRADPNKYVNIVISNKLSFSPQSDTQAD